MSGLAFVIKGADFSAKNLGVVTPEQNVELQSLSIVADDTIRGQQKKLNVAFTPSNTNQKNVEWSIVSGGSFAEIDASNGMLTIKEGASASNVVVKVTSVDKPSVSASKTIAVTYFDGIEWWYKLPKEADYESKVFAASDWQCAVAWTDETAKNSSTKVTEGIAANVDGKTVNYVRCYLAAGAGMQLGLCDRSNPIKTNNYYATITNETGADGWIEKQINPIEVSADKLLCANYIVSTKVRCNDLGLVNPYYYSTGQYYEKNTSVWYGLSVGYKE